MGSPSSRKSDASFKANAPDAAAKAAKRDLEKISVSLTVNGQRRMLTIEPRMTLLDAALLHRGFERRDGAVVK